MPVAPSLRTFPVRLFVGLVVVVAAYDYFVLLDQVTGNHRQLVLLYRMLAAALVAGGVAHAVVHNRAGRWMVAAGALIDGGVTLAYMVFARYFGEILSIYDASSADEAVAVMDYVVADLVHLMDLRVLVAPIALVVLAVIGTWRPSIFVVKPWSLGRFDLRWMAVLAGGLMYLTPYVTYRSLDAWRTQGAGTFIHVGGLLGFLSYDLVDSRSRRAGTDIDLVFPLIEGESYVEVPFEAHPGANVILLQVESLDFTVLGRRYEGTEVAPFIDGLSRRSFFLRRHIALHTKGSADADASAITGAFTVPYRSLYSSVDLKKYPSLPRDLRAAGYTTAVFHSNRGNFHDRDKAVRSVGFEKSFFQPYYAGILGQEGGWGVNDEDFLRLTAEEITRLPAPFFAHVITITSHGPFDHDIKGKHVPAFASIEDPMLRGYFDSIHFVDQAVELFFGQLEEAGLMENTIIVLYGDHDSHLCRPNGKAGAEYRSLEYLDDFSCDMLSYPSHVPVMIVTPDGSSGTSDKLTLHVDLAPTVLDLVGQKIPSERYLGNSVYSARGTPMIVDNNREPFLIHGGCIYRRFSDGYRLDRPTRWLQGEHCPEPPEALTADADAILEYSRNMWRKYRR